MPHLENDTTRRRLLIEKFLSRELNEVEQEELESLAENDPSVGKDILAYQRARNAELARKILKNHKK